MAMPSTTAHRVRSGAPPRRTSPPAASIRSSNSRAPALESGSLRLPHFGDCTQEGQPEAQGHSAIRRYASRQSSSKRANGGARDADPAGMAVVDEDRRAAGLGVEVRGQPADVPAVAHRDQRQHGDLGVLGCVQRAEQRLQRDRDLRRRCRSDSLLTGRGCAQPQLGGVQLEPERLRGEARGRQIEPDEVDGTRYSPRAGAGRRAPCR